MINCKEEFLEEKGDKNILCVAITIGRDYLPNEQIKKMILPVGFRQSDYDLFLNLLDFEYDNGFGGQYLYGIIWYIDGTWSERGEYDGSEWWTHKVCPEKPVEVQLKEV